MSELEKFDDQASDLRAGDLQAIDSKEQAKMQEIDQDLQLEQALKDFKSSVHAWSDAAYSRPRMAAREIRHRSWRLALGWALGCLLVAGSASGGLLVRHHRIELEKVAAEQRAAEQQRQLREQQAAKESDEVLLAGVDSDISRQVPSALEPLAQMMSEDDSK
jgi:hypothetical protein